MITIGKLSSDGWRRYLSVLTVAVALLGCSPQPINHYVLTSTGTVIGLDLSFDPARQTPQGRLGYHRGELALVPSNRKICSIHPDTKKMECENSAVGNGAKDTTQILMEIYFGDIFSTNSSVYQRLAVGDKAVKEAGAAVLFAKNSEGEVDPAGLNAIKAIQGIPTNAKDSMKPELRKQYARIESCFAKKDSTTRGGVRKIFDAIVPDRYASWEKVVENPSLLTKDELDAIETKLSEKGIDVKNC